MNKWGDRIPCWNCGSINWKIIKGKTHGVVCECGVNPMAHFPKGQGTL